MNKSHIIKVNYFSNVSKSRSTPSTHPFSRRIRQIKWNRINFKCYWYIASGKQQKYTFEKKISVQILNNVYNVRFCDSYIKRALIKLEKQKKKKKEEKKKRKPIKEEKKKKEKNQRPIWLEDNKYLPLLGFLFFCCF